jgi:RimJ/RimL family protein N-acetyltransferase
MAPPASGRHGTTGVSAVDDHARTGRIAFRPLAEADFPDMMRWLSDPGVARWWPEADLGLEAITRKYTPVISGRNRCAAS